ncbi:MAG: formate--tetrahydrofolate ligase [Christensenellaceae bacterium]
MNNDLQIAKNAKRNDIYDIADCLGIQDSEIIPYGNDKAKISLDIFKRLEKNRNGKLVLVTAINPTPAGEGKTTVSIGLADAFKRLDESCALALREPSLGPVFGIKGGAAGGGYAQAIPMEDINLHFTGDLHAIESANNLLCALIDNHIYHGNQLDINPKKINFRRCMDMNDRQLRNIVCGMGKSVDGVVREDGFDITAASEVMAILCMATDMDDLKSRLNNITIAYNNNSEPVSAGELCAGDSMAVLLKDALKPNLVQTLEHTPVLMHGGPFANIAHGCNSVIATKMSMLLADYTVTEAGFGADLGAEKFLDIKCRNADIWPNAVVLVATVRALKFHGGVSKEELQTENISAIAEGLSNLNKHIDNIKNIYGLPVVVAINKFDTDTTAELDFICDHVRLYGAEVSICDAHALGGEGALDLARKIKSAMVRHDSPSHPYDYAQSIEQKIFEIATKIYGADGIVLSKSAKRKIKLYKEQGYNNLPICIAKTQYSLSDDSKKIGAPKDFILDVKNVKLCSGAGFIVVICGDIMRMPGLPKHPASMDITIDSNGEIEGLF